MALTDFLTQIAESIRSKDGTTDVILAADFPQRILDIPSGGGNDLPINIKTGSFTIEADSTDPITIQHDAGTVPIGIFVLIDEISNPDGLKYKTVGGMSLGRNEALVFSNNGGFTYGAATSITDITETTFTINPRNTTYPFAAGLTYRWWVWC